MSNAKYIGRVGGLAVALGVGFAVATAPGIAWADDTESAGSEGTTGTSGATNTGGPPASEGTSTTSGTTSDTTGTSTAAGSQTGGASAPGSGSVEAPNSGASASTEASVRQVPTVLATGGANSSKKSNSETSAKGEVAAASTTIVTTASEPVAESTTIVTTASEPVADSTATGPEAPAAVTAPVLGPRGGSNKRPQRVDDLTAAPGVDANTLTATGNAVPSRPEIPQLDSAVADVEVAQLAAPQALTVWTARTFSAPQTAPVARQVISAAPEEPPPPQSVSGIALGVLASLGPLATNGPLTPVDSPLGLALMAVGARPRQFGQAVAEGTRSLPVSPTLTSQAIDTVATADQQAFAAMERASATNSAPVTVDAATATTPAPSAFTVKAATQRTRPDTTAPTVSVTAPPAGTVSGTVTLSATASDNVAVAGVQFLLDGTPLDAAEDTTPNPYSVLWNTTTAINGDHTLTARARDAAGNTTTSPSVNVTVANAPQTTITVGTSPVDVAVTGVSGSRAYVSNYYDNTVSVIDTNTNTVIKTISVGASPYNLAASPDGTRVYVANQKANTVSVINTNTNMVVDTIAVPVKRPQPEIGRFSYVHDVAVSPDGKHVYVTGTAGSGFTSTDGTVSVIDTTTHAVSGPHEAGPAATGIAVSPDGTRLYVATELWNSNITVMDTAAMTVIGTVFVGDLSYPIDGAFTPDGKRLYMITGAQGSETADNAVMVIDTDPASDTYNTVIGTLTGYDLGLPFPADVVFSPDGGRAYVSDAGGNTVTVIDTSTNTVIGTIATTLSPASGSRHIAISPDGDTLYITDSAAGSVVTVSVASMTPTTL